MRNMKINKMYKYLLLILLLIVDKSLLSQNDTTQRKNSIQKLKQEYPSLYFYEEISIYNKIYDYMIKQINKSFGKKFTNFYLKNYVNKIIQDTATNKLYKIFVENQSFFAIMNVIKINHKINKKGYLVKYTFIESSHEVRPIFYAFIFKEKFSVYEIITDAIKRKDDIGNDFFKNYLKISENEFSYLRFKKIKIIKDDIFDTYVNYYKTYRHSYVIDKNELPDK